MRGPNLLNTQGQFGPVLLAWISKNDDEEQGFLK